MKGKGIESQPQVLISLRGSQEPSSVLLIKTRNTAICPKMFALHKHPKALLKNAITENIF